MSDENVTSTSGTDTKIMTIVGLLLLLIIAMLAGLTLRMRTRATRAERNVTELRNQLKPPSGGGVRFSGTPESVDAMLQQIASKLTRHQGVQRENLRAEQVHLNGRDVTALNLPADVAEKLGFIPGDVIIVGEPAPATTTAPITTMPR